MSLLLNLHEWIKFDDAMKRANQRGVFAFNIDVGLWTEDERRPYRQQLVSACLDEKVPLRFYGATDTLILKPKTWANKFVVNYVKEDKLEEWHEGLLHYHSISLHDNNFRRKDVYVLEAGISVMLYLHDVFESDLRKVPCCFAAEWDHLLSPHFRDRLEIHRPSLDAMLDKAIEKASQQRKVATSDSDDNLPPRTAGAIYKEYRAMAETIAKLASKKAASIAELAQVVIDECEKVGHPMPAQHRTVRTRLEKT